MTDEEKDLQAVLSIFVPANQAAICADCGGVFLLTARHCPGCSSSHWILLSSIGSTSAAPVARIEGEAGE